MNNNKKNINLNLTPLSLKPIVIYPNCLEDKKRILLDNKGKAAIYR